MCCSPQGCKESDTIEQLNCTDNIYMYVYIYFSGLFPLLLGYYRILRIVPCAVQYVLAVYLFYI